MKAESKLGFTLVELLTVVAILAVLAGIVFPVYSYCLRASKKSVALNNLRQSTLALTMYAEGNDGLYPVRDVATRVVGSDVSCDPLDVWRKSCREDWPPLVGSFGYPIQDAGWVGQFKIATDKGRPTALLASIFHEPTPVTPFHGDVPPTGATGLVNYRMPDHVLVGRTDGSAARVALGTREGDNFLGMTWSSMFWKDLIPYGK